MKIIFMGTPEFAVPTLESLDRMDYDIPLVITQTDKRKGRGKKTQFNPVKQKALDLNIEVYQPEDVNCEEAINKINELKQKIEYYSTPEGIARLAREQFNLVLSGEVIYKIEITSNDVLH